MFKAILTSLLLSASAEASVRVTVIANDTYIDIQLKDGINKLPAPPGWTCSANQWKPQGSDNNEAILTCTKGNEQVGAFVIDAGPNSGKSVSSDLWLEDHLYWMLVNP